MIRGDDACQQVQLHTCTPTCQILYIFLSLQLFEKWQISLVHHNLATQLQVILG